MVIEATNSPIMVACSHPIQSHSYEFALTLTLALWNVIVGLRFCFDLRNAKVLDVRRIEAHKDVKAIKISSIFCVVSYILGSIELMIGFIGCDTHGTWFSIGIASTAFGTALAYTVFGFRLCFTFKNTSFAISNCIKSYVVTFPSIVFIMHSINTVNSIIVGLKDRNNDQLASILGGISYMFLSINGLVLLCLFIKKLSKAITHCVTSFGHLTPSQVDELSKSTSDDFDTNHKNADFATIDQSQVNIKNNTIDIPSIGDNNEVLDSKITNENIFDAKM